MRLENLKRIRRRVNASGPKYVKPLPGPLRNREPGQYDLGRYLEVPGDEPLKALFDQTHYSLTPSGKSLHYNICE